TFGSRRTLGGKSHSWLTPTKESSRPSRQTISVALGRRETMRIASASALLLVNRLQRDERPGNGAPPRRTLRRAAPNRGGLRRASGRRRGSRRRSRLRVQRRSSGISHSTPTGRSSSSRRRSERPRTRQQPRAEERSSHSAGGIPDRRSTRRWHK